ncbi:MAG: S9 family peptidase, partial [Acidimicrobiales bacterium]
MHLEYPPAPFSAQIDDYHGETVADPFRWLEDTSSEETRGFIEAENRLADAWLEAVPSRKEITRRVHELWDHPRFGVPFERGGRWFQYRNTGLQPQPVLYVMDRPGADGEILVDPNAFSEDGTVALVDAVPSADGRLLAYATADAGSDWLTWKVLDVDKKTRLPDVVEWSKFSTAAWLADASGFFYGAPRRPELGQELEGETRGLRVLFHLLGAKDGEDEVVFSAEDQPDWLPHATVTDDGQYLVVAVTRGTRPQVRLEIFDLERLGEGSVVLDPDFSSELAIAGNEGPRFFLVTGEGADRRRLVATDLSDPEHLEEVVPESADVLAGAKRCGDALVCCYLKDARAALRVHGLDGRFTREIELP